jgi:hypothetical protein
MLKPRVFHRRGSLTSRTIDSARFGAWIDRALDALEAQYMHFEQSPLSLPRRHALMRYVSHATEPRFKAGQSAAERLSSER